VSWPIVNLGDVCQKVDYGLTASAAERIDGPRFLRITDMQDDTVDWDTVPSCECSEREYDQNKLAVGDIVFARTGATTGKSFLIRHLSKPAVFASYLIRVRPSQSLDPIYLSYFLKSSMYWHQISTMASGAAQPGVNSSKLKELSLPLPPLPEQKRIAAILDKADTIRRRRQQAIQLADDFLRAVFLDMFGDPATNLKGWETFALSDLVRQDSIITYGIVQAGDHVDGGVPYIRTGDFKNGKLQAAGYACTSVDIANKFKRSEVSAGDIVYCIRASIGSADIVPSFLDGANLTQGTAKISPAGDVKAEFLVELLRSAGFRSWIDKNSKGATFKEITLARLREAPVFKPPLVEQEAFVRIRKIVMDRLKQKFRDADSPLFESLSQRAFAGQL